MPRGGYRPGAGRKKGSKDKGKRKPRPGDEEKQKIREMLAYDPKAKARFYQEFLVRVSKGETLSTSEKKLMMALAQDLAAELTEDEREEAATEELSPLDFLKQVMMNGKEDMNKRMRAAEILAKYEKPEKGGKKQDKADRAKVAASGKFAPAKAPLALVK